MYFAAKMSSRRHSGEYRRKLSAGQASFIKQCIAGLAEVEAAARKTVSSLNLFYYDMA